jgi:hypothetical protein
MIILSLSTVRVIELAYYCHVPVIHFDEMASAETDWFKL